MRRPDLQGSADVITETPDVLIMDLRRFNDLVPSEPTPEFPYRAELDDRSGPASRPRRDEGADAPRRAR